MTALDQLSRQRDAPGKHGEDVRETLQWLDDITSKYPNVVTLQGADETYEQWSEVEKFVVPRTLFSEQDGAEDIATEPSSTAAAEEEVAKLTLDNLPRKTPASSEATDGTRSLSPSSFRSQRSSVSAASPPTSPIKENTSPANMAAVSNSQGTMSASGSVPAPLQPLFNYILWRIHQEVDPVAALESFIFLCNDQRKVHFAKGFEIKTKRLEQLREAINREDRDFRNRMALMNKEVQTTATTNEQRNVEDDDDDVIYKPPPRAPAAMLPKQQQQQAQANSNMMDPDAFGRRTQAPNGQQSSPKQQPAVTAQANRGSFSPQFGSRGNNRGNFRGNPRGRGNFGAPAAKTNGRVDGATVNGQIDPNSFSRPRGSGYTGRGGRKLWVPT